MFKDSTSTFLRSEPKQKGSRPQLYDSDVVWKRVGLDSKCFEAEPNRVGCEAKSLGVGVKRVEGVLQNDPLSAFNICFISGLRFFQLSNGFGRFEP
jgi:hypothetical protein